MTNYLVVGSGLFGAVFASQMAAKGHKVTVLEKREHIAGNIYTKETAGVQVHQYGAHIFHTSNKRIWEFVNQYAEFNRFTNAPVALSKGKLYNLPFNMNTFYALWGLKTPKEVKEKIAQQSRLPHNKEPENLEEQAISLVGSDIYETLIKEYTEKQWGNLVQSCPLLLFGAFLCV